MNDLSGLWINTDIVSVLYSIWLLTTNFFIHESYLSLSSSETYSNVFSLVLRCVRDEK